MQSPLMFDNKGKMWLLVDSHSNTPYRVVTRDGAGTPQFRTGWCKTLSYCERTIASLELEGWEFQWEIDVRNASAEVLNGFRLSKIPADLLRSAMQKYIRRGMVQEAVNCAYTLMASDGMWWLQRRLPILMVEDVDWRVELPFWSTEDQALDVVASMARHPKNREASWMFMQAWASLDMIAVADFYQLSLDIVRGYPLEVARQLCKAHQTESMDQVWKCMEMPAMAPRFEKVKRWIGMYGQLSATKWDAYLPLCAMAIHLTSTRPTDVEFEIIDHPEPEVVKTVDWWTQDIHTWVGRAALKPITTERYSLERVGDIQFNCESIKTGPTQPGTRWEAEALDAEAQRLGFASQVAMRDWWASVAPKVEINVNSQLKRLTS